MADSSEWTEQRLQGLVANQVQENLNLEYKRKDSLDNNDPKKNEIGKDVSAFANSDGGTIIYGMEERKHLPVRLEGVDPTATTREWLEHVIHGKIRPKIDGIRITPLPLSAPSMGTVFVVDIPASRRAAHMAADHKHYKRYNFESVPMEHYEIEDVRHRLESPVLSVELTQIFQLPNNQAKLSFHVTNTSPAVALYGLVLITVEDAHIARASEKWASQRATSRGTVFQMSFSPPNRLPIWEGVPMAIGASMTVQALDMTDFCVEWEAYSPNMVPQEGTIWFQAVNGAISEIKDASTIATLNERRAARLPSDDGPILH